ncbi:MAG: hypothetical protein QXS74_06305 [Nitrososphaeria archaeon]
MSERAKILKKKLEDFYTKEWLDSTEKWLKENFDYPKVHSEIPKQIAQEFHPIFRPLLRSIFNLKDEEKAKDILINYSRKIDLKNMRASLLPNYFGILCPVFRSRAVGNFGLINMVAEDDGFSRAFYNLPFWRYQKVKRTVISCYGIAKHGRKIEEMDQYPNGIFLLHPEKDPQYEKIAKYTDYSYVTLNWRFPRNYAEFIATLDGSVLISKSASKKLRYKKFAEVIIRNPSVEIASRRWGLTRVREPAVGARVDFQQPLTDEDDEEHFIGSSVAGTIVKAEVVNPNVADKDLWVWKLRIEDERDAEIGAKIESPQGLKHTIAGYVKDKEPVIVINPDTFKDRGIWEEIRRTNKIHCYISLAGKDGNISNKNIKLSRTFIQGLLCYPEKVRKKIIQQIFNRRLLRCPYDPSILNFIEHPERINPDILMKKHKVLYNYFFYTRKKTIKDKDYYYVEPTMYYRALKELHKKKDISKLDAFNRNAISDLINLIVCQLHPLGSHKKCKIKLEGAIRIILFHSKPRVNECFIGKGLYESLGKPEYVLFAKEPISRDLSIRCLKVNVSKDVPDWVVYIHPYIASDHEKGEFHTKIDTDGDLGILLPLKESIEELMYPDKVKRYNKLWNQYKNVRFDTVKHFEPYKRYDDFLIDVYEYNRRESIEQLLVQQYGGIKNRAMWSDIVRNNEAWRVFMNAWDIEYQIFQAEKLNPELKDAPMWKINEYLAQMLSEAQGFKPADPEPLCQEYLNLENITYDNREDFRKVLKKLAKADHPVLEIISRIYKELGFI